MLTVIRRQIRCHGTSHFLPATTPPKLNFEQLKRQIEQSRLEAPNAYARLAAMGLNYGPAHQGITAIYLGQKQVLAELRLPPIWKRANLSMCCIPCSWTALCKLPSV